MQPPGEWFWHVLKRLHPLHPEIYCEPRGKGGGREFMPRSIRGDIQASGQQHPMGTLRSHALVISGAGLWDSSYEVLAWALSHKESIVCQVLRRNNNNKKVRKSLKKKLSSTADSVEAKPICCFILEKKKKLEEWNPLSRASAWWCQLVFAARSVGTYGVGEGGGRRGDRSVQMNVSHTERTRQRPRERVGQVCTGDSG